MQPLPQLVAQIPSFLAGYDSAGLDAVWAQLSSQFRSFWASRIMASGTGPLPDADCDPVIRILDRNAKGNSKGSHAVARAMIPQGAWRRMLNELHTNHPLGALLDSVLTATTPTARASAIDALYAANAGVANYMTGPSGNAVSAYLAAYDPLSNLSIISLRDRRTVIDALGIQLPFDWDTATVGTKIGISNDLILNAARALGLNGSARTISAFFYTPEVEPLWKRTHTVAMPDGGHVNVTVPETDDEDAPAAAAGVPPGPEEKAPAGEVAQAGTVDDALADAEIRESMQIQALLAKIGAEMGFTIWLPNSDRGRVLKAWTPVGGKLLESLPLGYERVTIDTVKQIDVLWLKGRSIVRAFEVEHTTSIYSGLLRMADLVALQPNISVKLHIVASIERREKVLKEIGRPVFTLLGLPKTCTFISYDQVREISELKHLDHLSDRVLNEYEESAGGDSAAL